MLSAGTPSELSFGLLRTNSNLQEPNILFILEIHISSSTVFAQQSPKPSGQEFALTETPIDFPPFDFIPRSIFIRPLFERPIKTSCTI